MLSVQKNPLTELDRPAPSNRGESVPEAIVNGVVASFIATGPMTWTIRALQQFVPKRAGDRIPPRQITEATLEKADLETAAEPAKNAAATLAHYGFGASAGALMSLAVQASPLPRPVTGALYGLAVWGGSYLGWLPAAGLRRSATREPSERNVQMIAAHLVWGVVAAALVDRLGVEDHPQDKS